MIIVMARISNSKPPPAALVTTVFVFDDKPPSVGTSA